MDILELNLVKIDLIKNTQKKNIPSSKNKSLFGVSKPMENQNLFKTLSQSKSESKLILEFISIMVIHVEIIQHLVQSKKIQLLFKMFLLFNDHQTISELVYIFYLISEQRLRGKIQCQVATIDLFQEILFNDYFDQILIKSENLILKNLRIQQSVILTSHLTLLFQNYIHFLQAKKTPLNYKFDLMKVIKVN